MEKSGQLYAVLRSAAREHSRKLAVLRSLNPSFGYEAGFPLLQGRLSQALSPTCLQGKAEHRAVRRKPEPMFSVAAFKLSGGVCCALGDGLALRPYCTSRVRGQAVLRDVKSDGPSASCE